MVFPKHRPSTQLTIWKIFGILKQDCRFQEGGVSMFQVGDLMIYSSHGMCRVEDICDKTINGVTKKYYVLLPIESNYKMTIMTPVDNDKVSMLELLKLAEAEEIMTTFSGPGMEWTEHPTQRHRQFVQFINGGNRQDIAKVITAYLHREAEPKATQNRLHDNDKKLLENARRILFKELSACYKCSTDEIVRRVEKLVLDRQPALPVS